MTNVPYISIKSILYDLSSTIPERYWNETEFLEWAHKGLRRVDSAAKYENAIKLTAVLEHKAAVPKDLRYIIQIAYKLDVSTIDIENLSNIMNLADVKWSPAINHMEDPEALPTKAYMAAVSNHIKTNWKPMRLSSNVFAKSIHCDPNMFPNLYLDLNCPECSHEYTVDPSGVITTTLQSGFLMISYLRFPKTEDGDTLIPDNEELKEAIMHYCLWRYWLKKGLIGEAQAFKERDYHKSQFAIMKAKAQATLNSPDISTMENIKNQVQRLVPRSNQFDNFFSKLNNREKLND